ncbi:ABC transporter ATP-binding protein [Mycobacterium sp. 236(2023)]|uniref:ABC transporter ATP-binding protein n=1 Tax=Mycobacterium sp. 236(2023) TaxID=3038163 RepID=UPI002414D4EA|nr:ABC transporter ATP-binding protein [Mycobacterium sp. 236(2023)]MDG4666886.1 ABC transporter ATP-binding protein [Mycobacterium sp. 236(2023)]
MTDAPADVIVAGVHKSFGDLTVLRGIDLEAPAGTITAVLGPSGCGKTTLLRILAGFEDPDAGTVRIGGRDVLTVPAHRRRVGLMPQEGALFPHLDVGANITFGLDRGRRANPGAVVDHWLEVVGLEGLGRARPHELSGGQQQRVALARALAAQPRVLLLDEPFAALDAGLRMRVREDIAAILRETQTTALLVTHDQAEALSLADSVALLMDGTLAQHGTPAQLYRFPSTLAAARFVGATVELAGRVVGGMLDSPLGVLPAAQPLVDGEVVVVLRPEQVTITADGSGSAATVTASRFYGAETTVHVRLPDGSPLRLRGSGGAAPSAGDRVGLAVIGDVLAYPSPTGRERVPLGEAGG